VRRKPRVSAAAAGALLLLIVAIGVFFGFTKKVPFKHHYTVTAVVRTSNLLAKGSPVRIAGVNVGTVVGSGRYRHGEYAQIRMQMTDAGRPLRADASLKIRPRLFLEGNFYVDLQPGSPDAPEMPDGGVIPVTRTAVPVQLDQVLAVLQSDTRKALRETVQGLGDALGSTPTAKEDASQEAAVQGVTGGEALNRTLKTSPDALRDSATVLTALRGRVNGDLSRAVEGIGDVTEALAKDEGALRGVVRNFATTVNATGDNADALRRTVVALARTSAAGRSAFPQLQAALPPTRTASRDLANAMTEIPSTIDAARPWLRQARPLLSDAELKGLLRTVRPTLTNTARLTHEARTLVPAVGAFAQCMNQVFLPTLNVKLDDGPLSVDAENYKEFFYGVVGMNGEGQTFDGNGTKLRLQTIGGATRIKSGATNYSAASGGLPEFANITLPSTGTSPAFSSKLPPIRTDVACAKNAVPPLNGKASRGPADGSAPSAPATAKPDLTPVPGGVR
jgi:phospholipid/cholesterol/gamma-HCH transport system substrate-binding protein